MIGRLSVALKALSIACVSAAAASSAGCHAAADDGQTPEVVVTPVGQHELSSVILITLDGVRWQEVFRGVDASLASSHKLAANECV